MSDATRADVCAAAIADAFADELPFIAAMGSHLGRSSLDKRRVRIYLF